MNFSPTKKTLLIAGSMVVIIAAVVIVLISTQSDETTESTINSSANVNTAAANANTNQASNQPSYQYPVVDTGQTKCFNNAQEITCPDSGDFSGQDGNFDYVPLSYTESDDGTVLDNNTGLIWQQSADLNGDGTINIDDKMDQAAAVQYCADLSLAGRDDWRLPDIKTLYSLMNFAGEDVSAGASGTVHPFISTSFFDFGYGDESAGERMIDSQWATTTIYVSTVMNNQRAMFGLNLADGRIKGYPVDKNFNVKCVRGDVNYGINAFTDNGDGTITDAATGLQWQQADSGEAVLWEDALAGCQDLSLGGYDDWRLPNAKELQSIVDYDRSPDTSYSPAISPEFESTSMINERDQTDWGFYWASTTHIESGGHGDQAVYVSFGRAMGYMFDHWLDVHGAGAQRSDPKVGDPSDWPTGFGPQGDARRVYNYYRCVRGQSGTYDGSTPTPTNASADFTYTGGTSSDTTNTNADSDDIAEPPAEAISACSGKSADDSCSFTAPAGTVSGTCRTVKDQLACVP